MAEHSDVTEHEDREGQDHPGHYCGVAGILTKDDANIPELLFYPLYAQQHRGQESAGITYIERSPHGVEVMTTRKGLGLVSQVLSLLTTPVIFLAFRRLAARFRRRNAPAATLAAAGTQQT